MKLNELSYSPKITAQKALKEHYNMPLTLDRMSVSEAKSMLQKVRRLDLKPSSLVLFIRARTTSRI